MKAKGYTKETIKTIAVIELPFPAFNVGDSIVVSQRIKEGEKERIQLFQGDVIAIHKNHSSSTFTVRKMGAHNVPVERIFPYFSPLVSDVKIVRKGDVRRAKLYYIRDRVGKSARIKEKIVSRNKKSKEVVKPVETEKIVEKKTESVKTEDK